MSGEFTIEPRGPFSLRAAAGFGFGPTEGRTPEFDGAMRLAFPLDGDEGYAAVALRQAHDDDTVRASVQCDGPLERVRGQVERILSLDHDGKEFLKVGERDAVIATLQRAHPGQRPVLFHSPFEAAAWSIISARRPASQATKVRSRIAADLGRTFEVENQTLAAFPRPERLRELAAGPGLPEEKVLRLKAIADAALDGRLDAERLLALGPERALEEMQELRGIGPFYATLIVLRATGFADALLPIAEPKVFAHIGRLYALEPVTMEQVHSLAERWRPFRTWTLVLLRLAGERGA